MTDRDCEQEQSGDARDARQEAVETIQKVERVHHAEVPDYRERHADPNRHVDVQMRERNLEPRDQKSVAHRNDRDDDLRHELVARAHAHDVVPQSDNENHRSAEQQAENIVNIVGLMKDRRRKLQRDADRNEKRECERKIDCEATDSRFGLVVHAPLVHRIDDAGLERERAHARRSQQRRERCGDEREKKNHPQAHGFAVSYLANLTPASLRSRSANGSLYESR